MALGIEAKKQKGGTGIYRVAKRGLDILISYLLLAILYIPMLVIAAAIRLGTGESAIFRQVRVGADGRNFVCYKFRTMRSEAPSDIPTSDFKDAERYVTPVGRLLRATSLDELPQLFNVLVGDMSIVGPRPLIVGESEAHMMRQGSGAYSVRPGITGLAQINGRDMINAVKKVYYDTVYAYNMSFLGDARILFRTVFKVFSRDGNADG